MKKLIAWFSSFFKKPKQVITTIQYKDLHSQESKYRNIFDHTNNR